MHSQRGTLLPIIQIQLIGKPAITVVRAAVSSSSQLSTAAAAAKSLQSCLTLCDPTRLCCLWDSPGKNTGVGCHFLLQYMKVKSESEIAQSCPTLCNPMDCSLPGSSVHGIFQARVLEWGAIRRLYIPHPWSTRETLHMCRNASWGSTGGGTPPPP